MKWLDNIKEKFGWSRLRKDRPPLRTKEVHNFEDAQSVGILYKEKGEGFYILVKQYVKYLKSKHGIRDVMAFCYIDEKGNVPHYQVHKLKYDYFDKSEVNWRMEPISSQATKFVETEYDILIDLEREPVLPLQFILARSRARFKVGYFGTGRSEYYDLMIDVPPHATFDEYINQVNHYLTLINRGNARA